MSEHDPLVSQGGGTEESIRSFGYGESNYSENDMQLSERSSDLLQHVESNGSGSSRWKHIATILRSGSAFNTKMKLIALLSDREKALAHKGVGAAAFLIQEAVLGRMENPAHGSYDPYINPERVYRNALSIICRRLCSSKPVIQLLNITAWMLLMLSFVEPPVWCRVDDYSHSEIFHECAEFLDAEGFPATSDNTTNWSIEDRTLLYPNTRTMIFSLRQSKVVEAICIAVICCILLLRLIRDGCSIKIYLRQGPSRSNRIIQLVSIAALLIGLFSSMHRFQGYFRLTLLLSFLTKVQRHLRVMVKMLPGVFNVLLLLGVFILFYAWFGCVMFVGTPEGQMHFSDLIEGVWSLYICVTTANYPDVMMPIYNVNRWTAIYFVSFMILSFFFLMNIILAAVVNEYDSSMEEMRIERRNTSTENLKKAFAILDREGKGRIDRETVMGLFCILNEDFPEFRFLDDDDTKLVFAILDRDGTNLISEEEFMDFGNVLLLDFTKASEYATMVERRFPKLFAKASYQKFCRVVKSQAFEYAVDAILVLNAVVIGVQSYPELSGNQVDLDPRIGDGSIDTYWELAESIFTIIYLLEMIAKLLVLGWKKYVESTKNIFDFTITVMAVVSSAIVYYPNAFSDSRIIRMIVLARVLRLVRLLTAMKRFQLIGAISGEILPAARSIVTLLFLLMYAFACMGVSFFGGLITRDPDNPLSYQILGTDFDESNYWANNFNDMTGSMNSLFNLLVVNNWTVFEIGFESVGSKVYRLYFVAYHLLAVVLVNNVVIAFIIDQFLKHLAIFHETTDAEFVGKEAVLNHRQAVFQGSSVTGTKTGLTATYIARIRRSDQEGHDHDRLRKLFTQSSSGL